MPKHIAESVAPTPSATYDGVDVSEHDHDGVGGTGEARLAAKDRRRSISANVLDIGASQTRYVFGSGSSGWTPPENITIKKISVSGNSTLTTGSLTVTIFKNTEDAGNDAFSTTRSFSAAGFFKDTDSVVNNSGKDAITTSDTLFVKLETGALTDIDDLSVVLDYLVD